MVRHLLSGGAGHTLVFRVLGAVLLLAAALKGYQLATAPVVETGLLTSRWCVIGLVEFETAFGLWLWFGLYPRQTRWAALGWFGILLAASLSQALSGKKSCSCLGPVPAVPWAMVLCDLAALGALGLVRPAGDQVGGAAQGTRMMWLMALFLSIGVPGAAAMGQDQIDRVLLVPSRPGIDLGVIPQGGTATRAFSLHNPNAAPVEIAEVDRSCECVAVHLATIVVLPGDRIAGTVQVDLRDRPDFAGTLDIMVRGKTASGGLAFVLPVTVHVAED